MDVDGSLWFLFLFSFFFPLWLEKTRRDGSFHLTSVYRPSQTQYTIFTQEKKTNTIITHIRTNELKQTKNVKKWENSLILIAY